MLFACSERWIDSIFPGVSPWAILLIAFGDENSIVKFYAAIIDQNFGSYSFFDEKTADMIAPEIENDLFAYIHGIVENNGSKLIIANGTTNHVHLLISLGRKIDVGELIGDIKRDSSVWIKTKDGQFANFYWQKGYGAFSIGQSQVEIAANYIRKQKEHHAKQDYKDELRTILKKYEIEYDERYIWD